MTAYFKTASKAFNMALSAAFMMASSFLVTAGAYAADCGEQPMDAPVVPTGDALTADSIRRARDAVLAYSEKVDAYINCMDEKGVKVAAFMTKEQKQRRQDDLAELHNNRRDLQIALNEAIREFRRSRQSQ